MAGDVSEACELEVDGVLGPKTVSEWQRQLNVTVDGCVSGQLKDCQRCYPSLVAVTFEGTGSRLVRKIQWVIGVQDQTGVVTSETICMLQGWLYLHGYSCASDTAGQLGEATAKSIQRSLNDGMWEY